MADIYDKLLDQAPSQNPRPEGVDIYDQLLNRREEDEKKLLVTSLQAASQFDPNKAAEAQRLGAQVGVPSDIAERNLDEIRARVRQQAIENQRLMATSPVLARQLQDLEFAKIAQDQLENLSTTEKTFKWFTDIPKDISKGWEAGRLQSEQGFLGEKLMRGAASPEDIQRIGGIDTRLRELKGTGGFAEATTKILGQMSYTLPESIAYGQAGAVTAGSAAFIAGQLGPQAAIPEEIFTVPSAAIGGFFAGSTAKMAEQSYRIEAGQAYLDMVKDGIDKNVARNVAAGVGLVNGTLEVVGISFVTAPIKAALIKEVTQELSQALTKPTTAMAVKEFAKNYGKAWTGEVTTELLQEVSAIAGDEIARSISRPELESKLSTEEGRKELAQRMIDVFEEVGKGMAVLALPGASFNFHSDYKRAQEAKRQSQFFADLTQSATESEVRKRNPTAYENFIQAQAANTGAENVYVDAQQFVNVLRQANISTEQLAQTLPEVAGQVQEALQTGGDVVIPTQQYAARIAGTEFGDALMQHARIDPDAMSASEAVAFEQNKKQIMAQAGAIIEQQAAVNEGFAASAKEVETKMYDQLMATGQYQPKVARTNAEFVRDFVVTQAAALNMMPEEFYDRYMYKVEMAGQQQAADVYSQDGRAIKGGQIAESNGYFYKGGQFLPTTTAEPGRWKVGNKWVKTGKEQVAPGQWAVQPTPFSRSIYSMLSAWMAKNPDGTMRLYEGADGQGIRDSAGNPVTLETTMRPGVRGVQGQQDITVGELIDAYNAGQRWFDVNPQEPTVTTQDQDILKQSATLRSGKETLKKYGLDPNGTYKTRDIAAALEARQRNKWGTIAADERGKEAVTKIAKWMQAEVEFEMQNPEKSGVGWYSKKFQRALDIMGDYFPELKTDKTARNTMTALIAITSDGQKVMPNFAQAMDYYDSFRSTGKFESTRGHARQASIDNNIAVLQRLHDTMGAEVMHEYLMQEKTISELKQIARANGGEMKSDYQAHIKMPMAAVEFGPKLGAFYANLMGAHGYLTMDRWWSRTFNRYRGNLLTAPTQQGLDRFKQLLGKPKMSNDEAIAATVEPRNAYADRGFKNGTEIEKAANTIYKAAFEALEDAPFNATDRTFMLDAVNKAQQNLAKKGYELSIADIQAILWYYEKRLYGELGARQSADISYEEAAKRVVAGYANRSGDIFVQDEQGQSSEDGGSAQGGVPVGEETYDAGTLRQADLAEQSRLASQQAVSRFTQQARGGFDPRRLTTILNEKTDLSTFLHETAHFFLTVYADMANQPNATPQMKADMQTVLDWFGVKDLATWNAMSLEEQRKYHEQFAYNYELYLFEGKAPSVQLQSIFDRFSAWLRRVYQSIREDLNAIYRQEHGEDLPILTGEVRQVMDRMLASEEQVKQAESVRSMVPMFLSQQEAGMDDATWAAYQAMLQEARDAAVTDLTKATMRQMKWLSNARSRVLKELQKQTDTTRKEIRAEVAAEVEAQPVYRAIRFLKRGELLNADGTVTKQEGSYKLSTEALEAMYMGEGDKYALLDWSGLGTGQYGMIGKEGLHPDVVAEIIGFDSGDQMVRAILAAPPLKDAIDQKTDARMMAEHAEMTDPKSIEMAVEQALHNEARARFVAVELRYLAKSQSPVRVMLQAAKQAARELISRKAIKDIKPREYSVAEGRAAKASLDAMKKGNSAGAAQAKQNQLLQNQLAAEAVAARNEVEKALDSFKKLFRSDEKIAANRNMDLVDAARSILAYYGLGKKGKSPLEYVEKLRAYNPDLYAEIEPLIIKAAQGATMYNELTMDEFRAMRDTVEALWFQSKRENEVMIEGRAVDLKQVTGELNARLEEIGIPAEVPGERQAPGKKDRWVRSFYNAKAITRRVEHWADATDGAKGVGPFTKYIWRPIRAALDEYRQTRNIYVKRYVELIQKLELPVAKIEAPELRYTFGNENGGIGKAELLGALLHTGNESNLKKLLLGRGWGTLREDGTLDAGNWQAFIARMITEGKLTKADFDFAQAVWDLNEELKPMAQKAHHDLFGYYFKEVEASPVVTPYGVYRGGYVPAKTDTFLVRDAQKNAKMEELESDFRNSMPSTGMGFTKGRVEYNKPLSLDIRLMAKHIDDVIRFAKVQPSIKDALRILRSRDFADNLTRLDPTAIEEMLLPWLNRAARQITGDAGMHKGVDQFWRTVRSRTGISIMFANITNALQQLTGYFPAALKVKPSYLKNAMVSYISNTQKVTEDVAGLSPFMADRLKNQVFDMQDTMNELLLNPTKFEKIQKWSSHHGYFLQQAFQNQVDVVTWTATFNQTLAELGADKTDEQAVREATQKADAAVRLTQSSLLPEDVAAFEVGSPFYKTLVQFSGYFNMLANLNANEYVKVFRDLGWRGNKGKLFMIYLLGFGLPMLMSDAIVRTLGGQWDDEDDDGYLDEVMEWFFGSQIRGAVAMVPAFGPGVAAIGNAFNNKPYDDRMTTSPSVSALEGATVGVVKAGINIVDPDKQVTGKNIRDILTMLSLATGIPLTVLGRPIGYAWEVERGKVQPTSGADYARGLVTGKASEESRP